MANSLIALLSLYALTSAQNYGQPAPPAAKNSSPAKKGAQQQSVALIPAVPGRGLKDVPKIAIKYYDVSGKDFAAIMKSIEKQRPRDPVTKQVVAGGAGYELGASMQTVTTDGKCTVTGAEAEFAPTAELPRLQNETVLKPDQLATWRAYLSQIEEPAAASLWFVQDRIPAFEKSMIGKECELAGKLGAAGVEKMRADQAEFMRQYAAAHAAKNPPSRGKK